MGVKAVDAPAVDAAPTRPLRPLRPDWAMVAPPAATAAVMLWGVAARPYWGDEADTVSAASRSLPQLARLLGHIDAVHGLYYLLMWPVIRTLGPGELTTRLPSAAAMAAAALGVAAIGRRLGSRRAGLCAGLVFAALPMVTVQGHDARPYAMAVAAAVLASLLLIRAAEHPRALRLAGYGLALALLGYLEVTALLIVPAHAITLLRLGRRPAAGGQPWPWPRREAARLWRSRLARRWLATVAAVAAALLPLVTWGWLQRQQIAWIPRPTWTDLNYLVDWLALGSSSSAVLLTLLAAHGARRSGPAGQRLAWLAAPWLALPPLALLAVSEIRPAYNFRYVTFCLPAVALLAGAGLAALPRAARAAALALVVALAAPAQLSLRVPGAGMRAGAQVILDNRRPGDAFLFPGSGVQPWYLAYPRAFAHLRNIDLAQSPAASGRLYGTSVPLPVLMRRERSARRVWVIEMGGRAWQSPAAYLAPGFHLARFWRPGGGIVRIGLYER